MKHITRQICFVWIYSDHVFCTDIQRSQSIAHKLLLQFFLFLRKNVLKIIIFLIIFLTLVCIIYGVLASLYKID